MEAQANASPTDGGGIWMRSMVQRNVGKDAAQMVADVRHKERSGTVRKGTWPGQKTSHLYTRNTMGYQILDN